MALNATVPILSAIAQAQTIDLPPAISQFLEDSELIPVACGTGAASILFGQNQVCVQPSAQVPPGDYIYDETTDQIRLIQSSTGSPPPAPYAPPPTRPVPVAPPPSASPPSPAAPIATGTQFTFTNLLEYSDCLEDILRFYQEQARFQPQQRRSNCAANLFQSQAGRGLSREQAIVLIREADAYATLVRSPALYPPRGIRSRVAQEFGFSYAIDTGH